MAETEQEKVVPERNRQRSLVDAKKKFRDAYRRKRCVQAAVAFVTVVFLLIWTEVGDIFYIDFYH